MQYNDSIFIWMPVFTIDHLQSISPTYPLPVSSILKVNVKPRRMHTHIWLFVRQHRNVTFQESGRSLSFPIRLLGNWDSQWGSADNLLETEFWKCCMCTKHVIYVGGWRPEQPSLCGMEARDAPWWVWPVVGDRIGQSCLTPEPGLEPRWYISSPPPSHSLRNAEGRWAWGQGWLIDHV